MTALSGGLKRERLLFLSQCLPFPPDGGVRIRSFHMLRLLAQEYDVTALCFYRAAAGRDAEQIPALARELGRKVSAKAVEAFPIPQEQSRARFLWDHARSVLARRAYTVFTYRSGPFRGCLAELLRDGGFDLVHLESLDLAGYLDVLRDVPVVCDHHNVESELLARRAGTERSRVRRMYLRHQARLVAREEARWCPSVDLNLTVSSQDRRLLEDRAPGARVEVIPNGVDTTAFTPSYGGDRSVVFVGGHTWFPNRDGMEYFATKVLPMIRAQVQGVPIRWIGRAPDPVIRRYRDRFDIELTGYVEDIRPYVESAGCFIVPLRVGGGTRLKILDAWAMGKAVVSTPEGCEGLDARDGENILIRRSPEEFANGVVAVLEDQGLRSRLGRNGRETVETTYDWEVVGRDLLRMLGTVHGAETTSS